MRLKERIDNFLKLVDWRKLQTRWGIEDPSNYQLNDLQSDATLYRTFLSYWRENYDQRVGQVLINLNILPDSLKIWNDEEEQILESQGVPEEDFLFWGQNYDKDKNRLPETMFKPISQLNTDHIKAILDGDWVKSVRYELAFERVLKQRENEQSSV